MTADVTGEDQLRRLVAVMHALRKGCPWDMQQTHASLLHYLVEETAERYGRTKKVGAAELRHMVADLKNAWTHIGKQLTA